MQNFDKQIINELLRVCSTEEVVLALLGEADKEVVEKVQVVARVLTDEWNEAAWTGGSNNTQKLNEIFSSNE